MTETRLSVVIPARNEEALIGEVLEAILASVARSSGVSRDDLWLPDTSFEVVVADDGSEDATAAIVRVFADDAGVQLIPCVGRSCAAARNAGAAASSGRVLCFVDADTIIPENAVDRILRASRKRGQVPGALSAHLARARDPRLALVEILGTGETPSRWRGPSRCRGS